MCKFSLLSFCFIFCPPYMSGAKLVDACNLCLLTCSHTVDLLTESHTHTSPAWSKSMLYHALQQACVCSESSSMLVTGPLTAHLYFLLTAPTEFPESRWLWPSHLLLDPFVILIKTRLTLKRIRKSQVGFWGQIPQIKAFLTVITVKNALGPNNWSDFNTYYKNVILNRDFSSVVPQYFVEGNSHWTVMVWGRNEHNACAHN